MISTIAVVMLVVLFGFITLRVTGIYGFTLQEVGVVQMAASRGEDYVEKNVGGCRLRRPLEVKIDLGMQFSPEAVRKAIWKQVKKIDPAISAVSYKGHLYSF